MYVCVYVCMYACMHACMHVCMYACMYACAYMHVHTCIYTHKSSAQKKKFSESLCPIVFALQSHDVLTFSECLLACGWNRWGQLGLGDTEDRLLLTPVPALADKGVAHIGVCIPLRVCMCSFLQIDR